MDNPKKVYMVYYDDSDQWHQIFEVIGFFDTEEKANIEAERLDKENGSDKYYYSEYEIK